jgi:hypothetical protein
MNFFKLLPVSSIILLSGCGDSLNESEPVSINRGQPPVTSQPAPLSSQSQPFTNPALLEPEATGDHGNCHCGEDKKTDRARQKFLKTHTWDEAHRLDTTDNAKSTSALVKAD